MSITTVGQLKQALAFFKDDDPVRVLAAKNEIDAIDIKTLNGRVIVCPARPRGRHRR